MNRKGLSPTIAILLIIFLTLASIGIIFIIIKYTIKNSNDISNFCLEDIGLKFCQSKGLYFDKVDYWSERNSLHSEKAIFCKSDLRNFDDTASHFKFLEEELEKCKK